MNAFDVANKYAELIRLGRYDEIGELWADDAVFYSPHGHVISGKSAIKAFYPRYLSTITPIIRAARPVMNASGDSCVVELEVRMRSDPSQTDPANGPWKTDEDAPFVRAAMDRFTLNSDGKIQEMIVYLAPPSRWVND
jgi:ketosteroid isomerase-like protein